MKNYLEEFQHCSYVKAAREKIAQTRELPDGFMIYQAGWLGDITTSYCVMELTGAVFRKAKRGPRKGQLCIQEPGAPWKVYLTSAEVDAAK